MAKWPCERQKAAKKIWRKYLCKISCEIKRLEACNKMPVRAVVNGFKWHEITLKRKQLMLEQGTCSLKDHMLYLVLVVYEFLPPKRSDLGNIRIVRTSRINKEENHLNLSSGWLNLANYKTAKRYGRYCEKLSPELLKHIELSLQMYPRRYLFVSNALNPLNNCEYGRLVRQAFIRHLQRDVNVCILRHLFITEFITEAPAYIKRVAARRMLHSLKLQDQYRYLPQGDEALRKRFNLQ
jgi:integrase